MKMRNLLSPLVLAASISVPLLMTNTAYAGDHYYGHGRSNYEHGYRDGYRDSSDDERHYRRRARHDYYDYDYDYRPHRSRGHGYRRYGHRSSIDLVFHF